MSEPANSPVTPATPSRRLPQGSPLTPGHSITAHPSDPAEFITVTIHTAKCTMCDGRNRNEEMRRCPMCTWQICGTCRKAKDDVLKHGLELNSTGKARRKILPGIGGRTPTKRPATPALFAEVQSAAPAEIKSVQEVTPASAVKQKLKESAQEVTPPTSGKKRKLNRKATKSAPVLDLSDLSDDDDFSPEPASPTLDMSRKRQKTTASRGNTNSSNGSPVKRSRQARQEKSIPSEPSVSSPPKTLNDGFPEGMKPSENKEEVAAYYGLPAGGYDQHLLSRSVPVTNRTVRIPPNILRNFKPRKSAAEFHLELQSRVEKKLGEEFGWAPRAGVASANEPPGPKDLSATMRDVVEIQADRACRDAGLDKEQLETITDLMEEAAIKVRDTAYKQMAESFRASVAPGLHMQMDQLNREQQDAFMEAIHKASAQRVKGYTEQKLKDASSRPSTERSER